MKWLGHEIDQEGYKTEQRKSQSHSGVATPEIPNIKYFLLAIHFFSKTLTKIVRKNRQVTKTAKEKYRMEMGNGTTR